MLHANPSVGASENPDVGQPPSASAPAADTPKGALVKASLPPPETMVMKTPDRAPSVIVTAEESSEINATIERKQREREQRKKEREAAEKDAINQKIRDSRERKMAEQARQEEERRQKAKEEADAINARLKEKSRSKPTSAS